MDIKPLLPDYLSESPYGISISESMMSGISGEALVRSHRPLPSKFNEHERAITIEVVSDGMEAKFGTPRFRNDSDAGSVRADHPIPKACGIYYFEVTIISAGAEGHELYIV